jgi:hypothetical protein
MSGTRWIGGQPTLSGSRPESRPISLSRVGSVLACGLLALAVAGCATGSASTAPPSGTGPSPSPLETSATAAASPEGSVAPFASETPTAVTTPSTKPTTAPSSGSHFTLTGSMSIARTGHTATLLKNGRVLVVGGSSKAWSGPSLASAELYDPVTGKFTPTGSMTVPRANHVATLLQDGRVLITGGHDVNDMTTQHTPDPGRIWAPMSAELYDPTTGSFTLTGSMTAPREEHTATLLGDGRVLITGGWDCSEGTSCSSVMSGELYDPSTGTFTSIGPAPQGTLATILSDGRVFLAADIEQCFARLYDPATGSFEHTMPGLSPDAY